MRWRDTHPPCEQCKIGQRDDINQCAKCYVELLPENEEPAFIFMLVRNQWVTAGPHNMPISVDLNAIHLAMSIYGVENKQWCLNQVMRAVRYDIDRVQQQMKQQKNTRKARR